MIAITLAQVAACGYILYICFMVLTAMSKHTRITVRLSYLGLAGGAFSGVVSTPTLNATLFAIGVALFLACNERRHHVTQSKSLS